MRRLLIVIALAALTASPAAAQTLAHVFQSAHMYPDGRIYFRADVASHTVNNSLCVMVRRDDEWSCEPDITLPQWMGWSAAGESRIQAGAQKAAIVYTPRGTADVDTTRWMVNGSVDGVPIGTFELAYRFKTVSTGVKSQWYYATGTRFADAPSVSGHTVAGSVCESDVIVIMLSGLPIDVACKLEAYDLDAADWRVIETVCPRTWSSPADPNGGVTVFGFEVQSALRSNGQTRYTLRTMDGAEHGTYSGPTLSPANCSLLVVE